MCVKIFYKIILVSQRYAISFVFYYFDTDDNYSLCNAYKL